MSYLATPGALKTTANGPRAALLVLFVQENKFRPSRNNNNIKRANYIIGPLELRGWDERDEAEMGMEGNVEQPASS